MTTTTRKLPIKYRRGKPLPALRPGDVIDLTTWPLRSQPRTNRPITLCVKCGRKGEYAHYAKGGESWTHAVRFIGWAWSVTDSCMVGKIG